MRASEDPFTVFINPPFQRAVEFVERSLDLGARKVIAFQRMAWWEFKARRDFWQRRPPNPVREARADGEVKVTICPPGYADGYGWSAGMED